jgi:hypothetical protein
MCRDHDPKYGTNETTERADVVDAGSDRTAIG